MVSEQFIDASQLPFEAVGEGVRRKILGYGTNLMMVYVEFAKGAVGCLHDHPHSQVTFVRKGSFEVQIGTERRILKEGDSFMAPPNTPHGVVALEEGILIDSFSPIREDFLQDPE